MFMAKTSAKQPKNTPAATRKPSARTSSAKPSTTDRIEKVSQEALDKLKSLNIEQNLQNDLEWCLGSYRADRNPVGLYDAAQRALTVLKSEKEKKTKGVTAKLITDLEKALEDRS
jgi:hypothetical protein